MKNRTILVTGATDGIGKQTALELARMGARVLLHGRDKNKGARVLEELNRETFNENLSFYLADFSSLADIRRMADEIKREQSELHVLVNNAGNFYKDRQISQDGYEMTFAINFLAPVLLTNLLLDLIKASAPARIVHVASTAHQSAPVPLDWDNLQGEKSYDGFNAYAISKLANICYSNELARRLEGSQVTSSSLHPGVIDTKLLRKSYDMQGRSVEDGAQTSVYLASSTEVENVSGKYFSRKAERDVSELAADEGNWVKFWELAEKLTAKYMD